MVFTWTQLDTLSGEELVEELIKYSNILDQLKTLADSSWEIWKVAIRTSNLKELKFSTVHRIVNLERGALRNVQYIRRKMLEINPVLNQ